VILSASKLCNEGLLKDCLVTECTDTLVTTQGCDLIGAESLELRRLKLDLIMMYGLVVVDVLFGVRLDDETRGDFKIFKPQCNVNCRAHSFACRRINCWNSLPIK